MTTRPGTSMQGHSTRPIEPDMVAGSSVPLLIVLVIAAKRRARRRGRGADTSRSSAGDNLAKPN